MKCLENYGIRGEEADQRLDVGIPNTKRGQGIYESYDRMQFLQNTQGVSHNLFQRSGLGSNQERFLVT